MARTSSPFRYVGRANDSEITLLSAKPRLLPAPSCLGPIDSGAPPLEATVEQSPLPKCSIRRIGADDCRLIAQSSTVWLTWSTAKGNERNCRRFTNCLTSRSLDPRRSVGGNCVGSYRIPRNCCLTDRG